MTTEWITMTTCELDRFKVIHDMADGALMPWRAAEQLELRVRQVERPGLRCRRESPAGLISRKRARPSNYQLTPGFASALPTKFVCSKCLPRFSVRKMPR
jgi:hypothetical protein